MFKKSNRNFRTKKAEIDSDEERNESKQKQEVKPVIQKEDSNSQPEILYSKVTAIKTTILSFNEEEAACEEDDDVGFKVKKSKESRRIAKELKKSKKEKEKLLKQQTDDSQTVQIKTESKEIIFNDEIRVKPLNRQLDSKKQEKSKYLKNKYKSNDDKSDEEFNDLNISKTDKSDDEVKSINDNEDQADKLNRLREEFEILNGEDLDPIDKETDEKKRSMKIMLKSGIIPDANVIHEARKKREMARQGDYIPIGPARNINKSSNKSRMIREDDDNDLSDDDHGEINDATKRLSMNYREKAYQERQLTRNNFLAYEQGSDEDKGSIEDEEEDEEDRWEKEQIKKGVLISQTSSANIDIKEINKKIYGANLEIEPMEVESTYKAVPFDLPPVTFGPIKDLIKQNFESLEETQRTDINELKMTMENLNANLTDLENLKNSRPSLNEQYVYFQEMNAYITDFIDCFNEKIENIEKAEAKWIGLYKQRAQKLAQRRQEDIRDQSYECSSALSSNKKALDPAQQRRAFDREARRSKRKQLREETRSKVTNEIDLIELNEGFSTDDEESQSDGTIFQQKREDILNQLNQDIFTDVLDDFYKFELIKQRFEKWKKLNSSNYKNAYVALSLPKLFSPLIRIELIDWNPLENGDIDFLQKSNWFKQLLSYNKQDLLLKTDLKSKLDDDFMLIPFIIEKVVLNKLIFLAESVYEPLSSKETKNFSNLILKLIKDYPTLNSQSLNSKKLIETIIARIKKTIDQDIFVPLYSKQIIEQKSVEASKFFHRQFWSCAKLYGNVLMWNGILSDGAIKELALDSLLNRYMIIGLQSMEPSLKTIYKIEYLVKKLPQEWLQTNIESTNSMSLPQLGNLIRLIRRIADQIIEYEYKNKKIDSKQSKDQIQHIRKLFLTLGATDQAVSLSSAYD